jgi:hypothetical protein
MVVKKFELHLDALIAIALLVAAAIGFIAFQRYQYLDLLRDNIDRQLKQVSLESQVAILELQLKKAQAREAAMTASQHGAKQ